MRYVFLKHRERLLQQIRSAIRQHEQVIRNYEYATRDGLMFGFDVEETRVGLSKLKQCERWLSGGRQCQWRVRQ